MIYKLDGGEARMSDLPNPPWRVLAYRYTKLPEVPTWYAWSHENRLFYDCDFEQQDSEYYGAKYHDWKHADEMLVIDHPHNDPEALEIIRKAKEVK